jgi:hypothetical protein
MSGKSNEDRPAPPAAVPTPGSATSAQIPVDLVPEEVLDWDAGIETAPPRPTRRIKVRLRDLGRDKPLPIEDPYDDFR